MDVTWLPREIGVAERCHAVQDAEVEGDQESNEVAMSDPLRNARRRFGTIPPPSYDDAVSEGPGPRTRHGAGADL
jgi:hypothetical protein